jgi:hypothetical protein
VPRASIRQACRGSVHEASAGESDWSDLRATSNGWAAKPLWSYADLEIRLPRREKPGNPPRRTRMATESPTRPRPVRRSEPRRPAGSAGDREHGGCGPDAAHPGAVPDHLRDRAVRAGRGVHHRRPGLMVLAGGILAYFVLGPLTYAMGWLPSVRAPDQAPGAAFVAFNRPLGIGLLLGGAMMGVLASLPAIREALKSVMAASKVRSSGGRGGTWAQAAGGGGGAGGDSAVHRGGDDLEVAGKHARPRVRWAAGGRGCDGVGQRVHHGLRVHRIAGAWQAEWDSLRTRSAKAGWQDQGLRPGPAVRAGGVSAGGDHRDRGVSVDLVRGHHHRAVRGHDRLVAGLRAGAGDVVLILLLAGAAR